LYRKCASVDTWIIEKCTSLALYEELAYHSLSFLLNKIFYEPALVVLMELPLDATNMMCTSLGDRLQGKGKFVFFRLFTLSLLCPYVPRFSPSICHPSHFEFKGAKLLLAPTWSSQLASSRRYSYKCVSHFPIS
jgi:hypothetical protein